MPGQLPRCPLNFNIVLTLRQDMSEKLFHTLVNSSDLQFAADLKMFKVLKGAQELQNNIDKLLAWANKWQLRFNASNYYVLHLGPHGYGEYNMQGTILSSSDTIKDLGIHIDSNLKFYLHTASVISKANRTLAIIHKCFHFTDKPHVCYSLQIFDKTDN